MACRSILKWSKSRTNPLHLGVNRKYIEIISAQLEEVQQIRIEQSDMMESFITQRNVCRLLLTSKGFSESLRGHPGGSISMMENSSTLSPGHLRVREAKTLLNHFKTGFSYYKKEKCESERMLMEQFDQMHNFSSELRIKNAKLSSQDFMITQEVITKSDVIVEKLKGDENLLKIIESHLLQEKKSVTEEQKHQSRLMSNLQAVQNLEFRKFHTLRKVIPWNTIIVFVPEKQAWIIERMGKYHKILDPGFNLLLPILDKVKSVQSLKKQTINFQKQSAMTLDFVTLEIDGMFIVQINDPYQAYYDIDNYDVVVIGLAESVLRCEISLRCLSEVLKERRSLQIYLAEKLNQSYRQYGISCLVFELRDVKVPQSIADALLMEFESDWKIKTTMKKAKAQAEAILTRAAARGEQLKILASAFGQ